MQMSIRLSKITQQSFFYDFKTTLRASLTFMVELCQTSKRQIYPEVL